MAVDGSQVSDNAFTYVYKDLMKWEHDDQGVQDTLVVGSITNAKKDSYLPYNMKSQYLSDAYEAKILPLGKHGRWAKRESDDKKSTKEQLWDLAEFEHCDLIVVGNHGRKGPK